MVILESPVAAFEVGGFAEAVAAARDPIGGPAENLRDFHRWFAEQSVALARRCSAARRHASSPQHCSGRPVKRANSAATSRTRRISGPAMFRIVGGVDTCSSDCSAIALASRCQITLTNPIETSIVFLPKHLLSQIDEHSVPQFGRVIEPQQHQRNLPLPAEVLEHAFAPQHRDRVLADRARHIRFH